MKPLPPEPFSRRLFAAILILLTALGVILLFKDLNRNPADKSRIDWPAPASAKP